MAARACELPRPRDETMTAMVSTVLRLLHGGPALLGGCARTVHGSPQVDRPQRRPTKPIPIADLLIEPTRFPEQYPAVVVDPSIVTRLQRQIDGVPDGSVVTPPDCAPPPIAAAEGAAVQGVNQQNGASLIVTVTRPAPSLRARVDQLKGCSSFTSAVAGDATQISDVTVDLPPAPPVDADDSYAVDQTVTPESSGASGTRTSDPRRPCRRCGGHHLLAGRRRNVRRLTGHPALDSPVHRCGAQGARSRFRGSPHTQSRVHPQPPWPRLVAAGFGRWRRRPSCHDDIAIRFPTQPARRAHRGAARRPGFRARKVSRPGDRRPTVNWVALCALTFRPSCTTPSAMSPRSPRRRGRTLRSRWSSTKRVRAADCATTSTAGWPTH